METLIRILFVLAVLYALYRAARWILGETDEVHTDQRPARIHAETAKRLGNPFERTVKDEHGQEVKERIDPATFWTLDDAGAWHLSRWDRTKFTASDAAQRQAVEQAVAYALECPSRGEEVRGDWSAYGEARFEIIPAPVLPTVAPTKLITDHPPLPPTKLHFGVTDKGVLSVPLNETSRLAVWDVREAAHILVTGATGNRKTGVMRAVAAVALRAGWEVVVLNGKGGGGWSFLRGVPGVRAVHNRKPDIVQAVKDLEAEAQRRYDQDEEAAEAGRPKPKFRRLLVIFDERMDVADGLDKDERPLFTIAYSSILRKAREACIHVADVTQRADIAGSAGKAMSGEARDNLPARLALGYHGQDASKMTLGDPALGSKIAKVPGRGIFMVGETWQHVQCFCLPDPRDDEVSEQARRETERVLPGRRAPRSLDEETAPGAGAA